MGVTQPAVSRLLRDLQATLKLRLFEKRGTGLTPTAAATALYTEVERSFVGLDRITAAADEIRTRRTGMLRLAALAALRTASCRALRDIFCQSGRTLISRCSA